MSMNKTEVFEIETGNPNNALPIVKNVNSK